MRFTRWDETASEELNHSIIAELAAAHAEEISIPRERFAYGMFVWALNQKAHRDQTIRTLCDTTVDAGAFTGRPLDLYHVKQIHAFFTKRADIDIGVDREAAAYAAFGEFEAKCAETNAVFKSWARGEFQFLPDVEHTISLAQRKIARVLGDVPQLSDLKLRFGPGATTNVRRKMANARNKLGSPLACSEDLAPALSAVLREMPAWVFPQGDAETASCQVEIHPGKLGFVPKNAQIYRTVITEPPLNGLVQLGIGDWMTSRFLPFGLDLKHQERNQALARLGSLTGEVATLDLRGASDLNAKELVYHMLPIDWASFLARFRTGVVEYKGTEIRLHKFSSMGNGFTFPLESLIFWALATSATQVAAGGTREWSSTSVSVFGDDIIVPTFAVPLLTRTLTACGHEVNEKKSFSSGPFRESCGKDYLSGIDVRPVYIKDRLLAADVFRLHNFYVRTMQPRMASICLSYLSEPLQLWGPDGYGDGHLLGRNPEQYLTPHRRSIPQNRKVGGGWGGWTFETYSWKPRLDFRVSPGDRVFPLYSVYVRYPWVAGAQDEYVRSVSASGLLDSRDEPFSTYRRERLGVQIPGRQGYRRIKIYTLDPNG